MTTKITNQADQALIAEKAHFEIEEIIKLIEVRAYQINGNYPQLSADLTNADVANHIAKLIANRLR